MTITTQPSPLIRRRTRIVATLGPASDSPEMIRKLIQAGVNVFRLNLSHGEHEGHRETHTRLRQVAKELEEPVAILADLCGPKIRAGQFQDGGITLTEGETVTVTTRDVLGEPGLIPCQYPELHEDVKVNDRILLDDGMLELRVLSVQGREIACSVLSGGCLKDRKGINLPGVNISAPSLTPKDCRDVDFVTDLGVDVLALSFVRRAEDVLKLRGLVESKGKQTPIIAKIEKPEALEHIDEILSVADGIMVARGDLGVEMSVEKVPILQQQLVVHARAAGKPVIVATQMLESMVEHPTPTRAEVSDVSQAVLSGADAVMLSAETSVGAYPLRAVTMMDRIIRQVEGWQWNEGAFQSLTLPSAENIYPLPLRHAIARSTSQLSRDLRVRAVVVRTKSGPTGLMVASTRPAAPVLAMTMREDVYRWLNLLWGVVPRMITEDEFPKPEEAARREVLELGLAQEGDHILLVAGFGKEEPSITVLTI